MRLHFEDQPFLRSCHGLVYCQLWNRSSPQEPLNATCSSTTTGLHQRTHMSPASTQATGRSLVNITMESPMHAARQRKPRWPLGSATQPVLQLQLAACTVVSNHVHSPANHGCDALVFLTKISYAWNISFSSEKGQTWIGRCSPADSALQSTQCLSSFRQLLSSEFWWQLGIKFQFFRFKRRLKVRRCQVAATLCSHATRRPTQAPEANHKTSFIASASTEDFKY